MNRQQDEHLLNLAVSLQRQPGVYALLLGSGISRAAGIPTGWEITLDLIRSLAGEPAKDWSEKELVIWYRERYQEEPDYSQVLERIAPCETERRGILEGYFEPNEEERSRGLKLPTIAHRAIAQLVGKGYIRMILTTNFDRLMEQALQDEGIQPVVIGSPEAIEGAPPYVHEKAVVVKLHGDYKDTRIKNSLSELAAYNPRVDLYLERVLDEFGLIVTGWSGEWDTALRNAILRMPNRRYSMYWLAHRTPRQKAQELIDFRQARVISGGDANSFFENLLFKVEALEEAARTPPQSIALLIAEVKRYLSQPDRFYIYLEDLLLSETKTLAGLMQGEIEACPWTLRQSNTAPCQQCLEYLETKSERFVRIVATIVRYDREEQFIKLIGKAFRILAKEPLPMNTGTTDEGRSARLYPLALALYATFITGVQESRSQLLEVVLSTPYEHRYSEKKAYSLVEALREFLGYSYPIFDAALEKQRYVEYISTVVRIREILIPWLSEFLVDADSAFFQAEFVLSLASVLRWDIPLPGLYLYEPRAVTVLTAFLRESPTLLVDLYESLEELLKAFDATAPGLISRRGFSSGFYGGAFAAFKGKVS